MNYGSARHLKEAMPVGSSWLGETLGIGKEHTPRTVHSHRSNFMEFDTGKKDKVGKVAPTRLTYPRMDKLFISPDRNTIRVTSSDLTITYTRVH